MSGKKSLRDWIKAHRYYLDEQIKRLCPNIDHIDDEERRQWVLNDEGLYRWAKSEGVNV